MEYKRLKNNVISRKAGENFSMYDILIAALHKIDNSLYLKISAKRDFTDSVRTLNLVDEKWK